MKSKILKYVINNSSNLIKAPRHFKPLSVGWQDGNIVLWVLVNEEAIETVHEILVYGTGWDFDAYTAEFIGTVQTSAGYAWHVFYNEKK